MYKGVTDLPIIVYDLETQNTFDDVGGRDHTDKLKISVSGVWDYQDKTLQCYRESQLLQWLPKVKRASLIIGFNSKNFDHVVLQKYFKDFELNEIKHLDILESVQKVLGFRLKLQTLVNCTLKEGKSGSGLDAIEYFRTGDWASLERYCLDDVRLTRDLFEYGVYHGYVWYNESETLKKIAVDWDQWIPGYQRAQTVDEMIAEAFTKGKKINVTYIEKNEADEGGPAHRPEWTLDILGMDGRELKVFINETQRHAELDAACVYKASVAGDSDAFQPGLF